MKKKLLIVQLLALCLSLSLFTSALAQTPGQTPAAPPKRVAVRAARMLDVRSGNVVANAVVIVENGRIQSAGSGLAIPAGTEVIDLGGAMLLPGLTDSHTHLLQNYDKKHGGDDPNMILTVTQLGTTKRALLGALQAREMLEAGFTSVRDLGNSGWNGDVALRDAIRSNWVVGPRLFASTRALSAAGGQFGNVSAEMQKILEQEYVVVSGVEDARRAVRQAFYDGADLIKVIVNTGTRVVSLEELKVIVEEAHRVNRKVSAHAIGNAATRMAAEAGVDSIEHAYTIPDDALKMMAEKKIFLVPTDFPTEYYLPPNLTPAEQQAALQNVRGFTSGSRERLARAIRMGVRISAGSDSYYAEPNMTRGQTSKLMFRAYAEAGMTPLEIIRAATLNNAELFMGERALIGSIEAGRFADLIAVAGDPLKDVKELDSVRFVMKGGVVFKDELTTRGAAAAGSKK